MKIQPKTEEKAASELISAKIAELADWRGKTQAGVRAIILEPYPQVTEEVKGQSVPVWSHNGGICTLPSREP